MRKGNPIIFEFGTEDVVKKWAKMILPKLYELMQIVESMESPEIGMNFIFEEIEEILEGV